MYENLLNSVVTFLKQDKFTEVDLGLSLIKCYYLCNSYTIVDAKYIENDYVVSYTEFQLIPNFGKNKTPFWVDANIVSFGYENFRKI
jgi:hypothetical protein